MLLSCQSVRQSISLSICLLSLCPRFLDAKSDDDEEDVEQLIFSAKDIAELEEVSQHAALRSEVERLSSEWQNISKRQQQHNGALRTCSLLALVFRANGFLPCSTHK